MWTSMFGPTQYDLKFQLLGIPARVHPTFWLGGLLFASNVHGLHYILLGIALLFVSIFVHEMGHALCGKHYGDRNPAITLHAMGGHYTPGITLRHGKEIWTLIWGPLAGFILGALFAGAYVAMTRGLLPFSGVLWFVLYNGMWINCLWGLMNLLPVFPLDGGQILREVVRWKYPMKEDAFSYGVSMYAAIVVAVCGIVDYIIRRDNYFIPIFFGVLAYLNYQLRKMDILTGGAARWEEQAPRQPWERDADWWKGGGSSGQDDADWWKR